MCYERVKQLICEQLGKSPDKVTMDTKIVEDLGADSLDVVEMLMALEDEYGSCCKVANSWRHCQIHWRTYKINIRQGESPVFVFSA